MGGMTFYIFAKSVNICTYIHTYIHTYIYIYIYTQGTERNIVLNLSGVIASDLNVTFELASSCNFCDDTLVEISKAPEPSRILVFHLPGKIARHGPMFFYFFLLPFF